MRPTLLRQCPESLPSFSQTVYTRLKEEVRRQGISNARLAALCGWPVSRVYRTFADQREILVIEVIQIASVLGIEDIPGLFRMEPGQKFGPER